MGGVTIVSRGVPDDRESPTPTHGLSSMAALRARAACVEGPGARAAANIHDSKANHTCENHAKWVQCGSFAEGRFCVARRAPSVFFGRGTRRWSGIGA